MTPEGELRAVPHAKRWIARSKACNDECLGCVITREKGACNNVIWLGITYKTNVMPLS